MTTNAIKGYSTTLKHGVETANTLVAEILDISGPSVTVDDIEVASMASANAVKEFLPGLTDGGSVTLDCVYEKAQCNVLHGLVGNKRKWLITLPDNSTIAFDGYLKGLGQETPVGDYVRNSLEIKLSGKPNFTAG